MEDRDPFETLFKIWLKERESQEPIAIPNEFHDEIYRYFGRVRKQLRVSDRKSLGSKLKSLELERSQEIVKLLFEARMKKILTIALHEKQPENLLEFEKHIFTSFSRVVSEYRERVENAVYDLRAFFALGGDTNYSVVGFLQPIVKIVGEDGKAYGPFRTGDVASLPTGNARILIKREVAKRISSLR